MNTYQRPLYVIYRLSAGEMTYYTDAYCTEVFSKHIQDTFAFSDVKIADRTRESLKDDAWDNLGIRVLVSKDEIREFGGDIEVTRTNRTR